jgi:hypothetical protein
MLKITNLPEREPEELIYGFQIKSSSYAIDFYICLEGLKFYCNYDRDFKDLAVACGIFMFGITNLVKE